MVKVIYSTEELIASELSLSDLQQSLVITYEGKKFRRKSDVPKKFKEKALNIYFQIGAEDKKGFISENTFSYTIWEEESTIVQPKKIEPHNSFYIDTGTSENQLKQSFASSSVIQSHLAQKKTAIKKETPQMKVYLRNAENKGEEVASEIEINKKVSLNGNDEQSDDVIKYRGVIINKSPQNNQSTGTTVNQDDSENVRKYRGAIVNNENNISPISEAKPTTKKTVRKYRGVIIEE
jgi:hypothetical protein